MAVWYCGSVSYAAVPTWLANHVYAAGAFVRQTAPTDANARVFRTTAGGTSHLTTEPIWTVTKGGSTTDNTVTWVEVTGNSAYGWSAAGKRIQNMDATAGWMAAGDTLYVANNHNYSVAAALAINPSNSRTVESAIICVDPAGSVPPVAADLSTGATETTTGANGYTFDDCFYMYGVNIVSGASIGASNSTVGANVLERCNLTLNNATGGSTISPQPAGAGGAFGQAASWKNVTVKFGAVGQGIVSGDYGFDWRGGGVDAAGSAPTNLFLAGRNPRILLEGLDLSILASNQIIATYGGPGFVQILNCILGSGYSVLSSTTSYGGSVAEMVISDSGNGNYKHERHMYEGDLLTELTNVVTGGANDGTRPFSWKVTTSAKSTYGHPFCCFTRAVRNSDVGVSKTLTVELMHSTTALKANEFIVELEYLASSSNPQATITQSANALDTTTIPTSTATWDTSGVGSPVQQKIAMTFTPQMGGDIRWTIKVAKSSKLVYCDLGSVANT